MARTAAARRLTATTSEPFAFAIAEGEADRAAVAALLDATPMDGPFRLAMSRGADPLASTPEAVRSAFVVARRDGEIAGVCEWAVWRCHVGGEERLVPYLGALRLAPRFAGRFELLRGGFAFLRALRRADETPFALTSIADDNRRALRALTSGARGIPRYARMGGYTTFALRARRRRTSGFATASRQQLPELAEFLNRFNRERDFSPVWSAEALDRLAARGLPPQSILIARSAGRISASCAVWDRRDARVLSPLAYPPGVAALRPVLNLAAAIAGRPGLPPLGKPLGYATVALLAASDADDFDAAIDVAVDAAARGGFKAAAVGLGAHRPEAASRALARSLRLATSLYAVTWPDQQPAPEFAAPCPELGFL